jgi:hypothetical protein
MGDADGGIVTLTCWSPAPLERVDAQILVPT